MLDAIMGFFTGGPLGALAGFTKSLIAPLTAIWGKIEDTKVQLAQVTSETDRARLTAKLEVLQARANLMVSESRVSKLNIYVRTAIGGGVAFLIDKILVWDKALGQWTGGHTDPISPELWHTVWVVLGFYFLYEGVSIFKKSK